PVVVEGTAIQYLVVLLVEVDAAFGVCARLAGHLATGPGQLARDLDVDGAVERAAAQGQVRQVDPVGLAGRCYELEVGAAAYLQSPFAGDLGPRGQGVVTVRDLQSRAFREIERPADRPAAREGDGPGLDLYGAVVFEWPRKGVVAAFED